MPRDAHGDVAGDHHQPDHRQRDLERRDDVDEVLERGDGAGVERVTEERRERVVQAAGLLVEPPFRGPDEQDRRPLEQRQGLDEVGLPEVRPVEAAVAALAARVVLLAVDDQEDDADRAQRTDDLHQPLEGVPVADDRIGEVGLEELEVRRQHGRAEEQEPGVDEPVHDADPVPLQHPGVEERLLEHRRRTTGRVLVAPRCRLAAADHAQHPAYGRDQHRDGDDGQGERDDDGEHLHEGLLLGRVVLSRSLCRCLSRRQGSHE